MQTAIDKNKFSVLRNGKPTLEDLFYAYNQNNINAVFIIMENSTIRQALYDTCSNLTFEEKRFLLGGTNPKDIANLIKEITE